MDGHCRTLTALPPEKRPIVQDAGWAPGPVWTGAENLTPSPTGIRFSYRAARNEPLYRLRYPGPRHLHTSLNKLQMNKLMKFTRLIRLFYFYFKISDDCWIWTRVIVNTGTTKVTVTRRHPTSERYGICLKQWTESNIILVWIVNMGLGKVVTSCGGFYVLMVNSWLFPRAAFRDQLSTSFSLLSCNHVSAQLAMIVPPKFPAIGISLSLFILLVSIGLRGILLCLNFW